MLMDDLIRIVREVHAGGRPIPSDVAVRLAARTGHPSLTPREIAVLDLVASGMRNKEIGAALGITEDTVEVHVRNLFAKLNVNDRTAAVTVALRRGIIHLS
jgi:DNA-binding NarL/FixJ family response regulator